MKPLNIALLALALAPALAPLPLAAQSLHDTHEMRWAPSGKTPSVTWHYRGDGQRRAADACRVAAAPIHLSGKTVMHAVPAKGADCGARLAAEERGGAHVAKD